MLENDMVSVPKEFLLHHPFQYPAGNIIEFERWFSSNVAPGFDRVYLPIHWTAYYCKHNYGKDLKAIESLQSYLNSLDTSKKYFTIVQYDDGILNDVSGLDLKIFAMSGGRIDYPLPLICEPAPIQAQEKIYLASFIGQKTHPIREGVLSVAAPGLYISSNHHRPQQYQQVIAQSIFTLCPRGYGPTSFRIMEALRQGSIPVYISDKHIIPYNIPFIGLLLSHEDDIYSTLNAFPKTQIERIQSELRDHYERYYTYRGCRDMIYGNLQFAEVNE